MATRQIKDAKDLDSNELIYFKGHAKATYMSDGRTVEDAINSGIGSSSGGYTPKTEIYQNYTSSLNIVPNTSIVFDNTGGGVRFNFTEPTDFTRMNEYIIMIKNHNSNSQVTFNKNIVWADDDVPELNGLDANAYELNIRCLNFSDGVYYLGTWTKFTL